MKLEWADGLFPYTPGPRVPEHWHGTLLGQKRDASGLMYRRNRYYDPATGRFTQEDPIGLAAGVNVYGFANGDPVTYSDPYGLCAQTATDTIPEIGFCRQPIPQGGMEDVSFEIALNFVPWSRVAAPAPPLINRLGGALASLLGRRTAAHAMAARLVGPDGALRVSNTVATRLAGRRGEDISSTAMLEAIRYGERAVDPQGVANHFMYTIGYRNGTLEVLVDESKNVINHVLYRAGR